MSVPNLISRPLCWRGLSRSFSNRQCGHVLRRKYATYRDVESSMLSQSLDTKQRAVPRADSVGPFRLGLAQSSLRKDEKVSKWSELSTGGKVMRTTARTTNLTVILLGAGLSALLIYSLTTELFSKNSPTVLYGDACERIKASPKVAKYLNGPLSFHNNPPSAVRPRHRNRHVVSQIMVDPYGQEHMIMTFYVQGQLPGNDAPQSESSLLHSAAEWANDKISVLSELTLDESIAWTKEQTATLLDRTKRLIKYLSGSALPPPPLPTRPSNSVDQRKSEESSAWNFAGMFSSLKGSRGGQVEPNPPSDGRVFTDGQVHASFIRNNDGYFVFRYLLVDIPSSRDPNRVRVFVERAPDVRDNEPVMRWNS